MSAPFRPLDMAGSKKTIGQCTMFMMRHFQQRCRQRKDLAYARLLYGQICESGLEAHQDLGNYLVSTFVDCRSMPDALHVFDRLAYWNEFSWTSLIQGWTECGNPEHSLKFFEKMQEDCIHPSKHTLVALLKACSQLKCMERGQDIHTTIVQKGFEGDPFIGNTMVDMYAKCGLIGEARQVFERLAVQNVVSWNALITGYVEHGFEIDALNCLEEMEIQGMSPDSVTFVCSLKACSILGDTDKGQEIHTKIMQKGAEKAQSVSTILVDMYIKCGSLMEARDVFDHVSDQNVVLWTALIAGYAEHGLGEESLKCLKQMELQGVSPDDATFVCILKVCGSIGSVDKGQDIHSEIVAKGMEGNSFVSNTLLDMYAKCGSLVEARHIFDHLLLHTVVSWNVLITGYAEHGHCEEALDCLRQMPLAGVLPDAATLSCSLKACGSLGALDQGQQIHTKISKMGLEKDLFVGNILVDMYAKCGSLVEAQKVFDQLLVRNLVSWNTLVTGYVDHELCTEALKCLEQMQLKGLSLDTATFICCLKACGSLGSIERGRQVHTEIIKEGLESESFVSNSLVDMYAKCGFFTEAHELFEQLPARNVISWSTLIAGYVEHGCGEEALKCLEQMQAEGVSPNTITYICSLKACGSIGAIDRGQEIHAEIIKEVMIKETYSCDNWEDRPINSKSMTLCQMSRVGGIEAINVPLANALIDMYCKCGSMIDAQKVFNTLPIMDIVSWNALITGYARQGESELVFHLFDGIREQGIQPNGITFLSVLTACSHAGLVDKGRKYFKAMDVKHNVKPTIVHYNCIVDLLGRAGQLNEAVSILKKMHLEPNLATWCTMLGACSKWGNVELGRYAFECAVKLDKSNTAVFIVMSNMYADAHMWEEVQNIEAIIRAWKESGNSHLESGGIASTFVVNETSAASLAPPSLPLCGHFFIGTRHGAVRPLFHDLVKELSNAGFAY